MRQKLPLILSSFGILAVLTLVAYLLKVSPKRQEQKELPEKPRSEEARAPVSSQDIPDFTNTFASASLNNLRVVSLNKGEIEINGQKYPKLDLTASLIFSGETKEITVSFIDKLDYKGTSGVPVTDIELGEGQKVTLRFWYVPSHFSTAEDKVKTLCESKNFGWCWHAYIKGFGQTPVDFPDYIKSLFEANDVVVLDYGILLPLALEISS